MKRLVWLFLAVVVGLCVVVASWPTENGSDSAARVSALSHQIRCPTCAGLSVAESEAPMAVSSRAEIATQVKAGRSDEQIREFFVSRYGDSALVTAKKEGAGLLPWLLVPLVVLIAGLIVFATVRKWRTQREVEPQTRKSAPQFNASKNQQRVTWALLLGLMAVVVSVGVVSSTTDSTGGSQTDRANRVAAFLETAGNQTAANKPADAVRTYDKALALDPSNTTALAYKGWLIRLAGLPDEGLIWIDRAIEADANYPDARFFKGFTMLRDKNNPTEAITQFDAFLALNPPPGMTEAVKAARAEAVTMQQGNQAAAKPGS